MAHKIELIPVGNGDMTLITLESGKTILIDCNIRVAGSNDCDECFDALAALKKRLEKDGNGRHYVDVFALSHPDQDHCRGFEDNFYVGKPSDRATDDDKIFIREIWSSPIVFRRFTANDESLCDDAKGFRKEAKRRVQVWRDEGIAAEGDRVLVLSQDEDGKTDDLGGILIEAGKDITTICGAAEVGFSATLVGPLPPSDDEEAEDARKKNRSSIILNFSLSNGNTDRVTRFLSTGDAGVAVWEQINNEYDVQELEYDILQAPHHCSWRSLSHDSWSKSDDPKVSADAKSALSNMTDANAAVIVVSSNPIRDDDNDPPCIGAKREYVSWLGSKDRFFCTEEHRIDDQPAVLTFSITSEGLVSPSRKTTKRASAILGGRTIEHG